MLIVAKYFMIILDLKNISVNTNVNDDSIYI